MDRNGPTYIVLFAAAVCLVCSAFVSTAAVSLKDRQDINKKLDQQLKVLNVTGLIPEGEKADRATIEQKFEAHVTAKVIDLATGRPVELSPEAIEAVDVRKAIGDPAQRTQLERNRAQVAFAPKQAKLYEVDLDGDKRTDLLVLPVFGKGLWSTLWGFIAVEQDGNTIKGITYYEHGETPGLGGEVDNPRWKALWPGRKIYDAKGQVAISVAKGQAGPVAADPHRVDGLSGATITANGVTYMLELWLGDHGYGPYLKALRGGKS